MRNDTSSFFTEIIPGDRQLWTSGFLAERFPSPVSPLGWSIVSELVDELAFRDPLRYLGVHGVEQWRISKLWRGHPYVAMVVYQTLYKVFPDFLVPDDAYRYFPDGDVSLRRQAPYPRGLFEPRFIFSMLRNFVHDPATWSPLHNYAVWAHYAPQHEAATQALNARLDVLAVPGVAEALRIADDAHEWSHRLLAIHRWSLIDADLTFTLLRRLARAWVDCEGYGALCADLVRGVPNKSTEVDAAIRHLADFAHSSPTITEAIASVEPLAELERTDEGRTFLAELQAFLDRYGHRSFGLDLVQPTFRDEPGLVLGLVRGLQATRSQLDITPNRQEVESKKVEAVLGPVRQLVFRTVLHLARRYVPLREDQRFYWQMSLAVQRRAYLIMGEGLARQGVLAEPSDVLFLTRREVADVVAGKVVGGAGAIARARRSEFDQLCREYEADPQGAYPAFLRGNEPLETKRREAAKVFQGRPVSPGLACGPARVVIAAEELCQVQPGDVLIAPSTDPGWTAVFGKLAGLVMERGGLLSHGAVVAREYGLPAVAGIPGVTQLLHNGEEIEVDGTAGAVKIVGVNR